MKNAVCICGAGTMGRGIALAAAVSGMDCLLYDLDARVLDSASSLIEKEIEQEIEKKRMNSSAGKMIFNRISFSSSITDCIAPVIIEAIIENISAKSGLFIGLSGFNDTETIFASNTSSLSVTAIAEQTSFPERIIGMHFFNPANRMQLVELIQTKYVSWKLIQQMAVWAGQLGKTTVICRDTPGFIVNHIARPFYLEALRLAEMKIADVDTIDKLMESAGFKMGPFHLMDLIGNDINYTVSNTLYQALGYPARLRPSPMQEIKLQQGLLGRKTGSGFFQYLKPMAG